MIRIRRLVLLALTGVLALALTACGGGGGSGDGGGNGGGGNGGTAEAADNAASTPAPGGGGLTVAVVDNEFDPPALTVSAGDTVTWQWEGNIPHNVVGDGFESELQSEGSFTYTFESAGTYPYECTVHPGMEGTITVQ